MREIKFRYSYTNGTNWFFKSFTLDQIEGGYQFDEISDQPFLRDYVIWKRDEYTGLKDKNGVEIYEGDITTYGIVTYINSCFSIVQVTSNIFAYLYTVCENVEVIGNIHEVTE